MLRIKEVAKEKGVTITDLAKSLGVKQVTLSRTINGNPTIETLRKIAQVLDVDIRELIEPTKVSDTATLYLKNDKGDFVECGALYLDTPPTATTATTTSTATE